MRVKNKIRGLKVIQTIGLILGIVVLVSALTSERESVPFSELRVHFDTNISQLQNELKELLVVLPNQNKELLTQKFKKARLSYKSIEPISAYFFANQESFLNGAPLMSFYSEKVLADAEAPKGFQILEETLFATEKIDIHEAERLIKSMLNVLQEQQLKFKTLPVEDRQVFELLREELIRINTMTLAGFDSPVLGHSLEEASVAWKSTYTILTPYLERQRKLNHPALAKDIERLYHEGINFFKTHTNFDHFDRAFFTRNIADPLYGKILDFHLSCFIETIDQVTNLPQRVNYKAKSIYASDFLNPQSFSKYGREPENEKLVQLGKLLFFDPILSGNNKRACASCHSPKLGFGDGRAKSLAFDGKSTVSRNAPTLLNVSLQNDFFWDLRSEHLATQIDHVVLSKDEFNTDFTEMVNKIRKSKEYVKIFSEAYHMPLSERSVSISSIKQSLVYYSRSLTSINTPFDQYMRKEVNQIDEQVITGYNLFMGKAACGTCHFAPTFFGTVPPRFYDTEGEVLGVPATSANKQWDSDMGRFDNFKYYNFEFLKGQFKTATVRNVAITGPYMHNGVYQTLNEVVDFYNHGGGVGLGFEIADQTLPSDSLHLSNLEKQQLIAFMKALTDTSVDMTIPNRLPGFPAEMNLNARQIGGEY